jgi:hypothetical protein
MSAGAGARELRALAIAQYAGESCYLSCDDAWRTLADTHHSHIEHALAQAAFDSDGVRFADIATN